LNKKLRNLGEEMNKTIQLNYRLNPDLLSEIERFDLSQATETDFTYYLFCGDLFFNVEQHDLDAKWGWIPVLGFAKDFYAILLHLPNTKEAIYTFTESNDQILLHLKQTRVEVKTTYKKTELIAIDYEQIKQAVQHLLKKILSDLEERWPILKRNIIFNTYKELSR
jgi:hypothetical protein